VRGEKNGDAAFRHPTQERFQRASSEGVDAFEWLIEKQNSRSMNYGRGEREFFFAYHENNRQSWTWDGQQLHKFEEFFATMLRGGGVKPYILRQILGIPCR